MVVLARELNLKQVHRFTMPFRTLTNQGSDGELVVSKCSATGFGGYGRFRKVLFEPERAGMLRPIANLHAGNAVAYTVKDKESDIELEVDNQYIMSHERLEDHSFYGRDD